MVVAAAPIFKHCGGFYIGSSLLLAMLCSDVLLSTLAMLYARFSLPAVRVSVRAPKSSPWLPHTNGTLLMSARLGYHSCRNSNHS